MNVVRVDEMNAVLKLLQEIRDRLPAPVETAAADQVDVYRMPTILDASGTAIPLAEEGPRAADFMVDVTHVPLVNVQMRDEKPARTPDEVLTARMPDAVALGHRQALAAFLSVLDGWIEGAYSNHVALDHRGEGRGGECWRQYDPANIRNMVNDAARQVGIAEFPFPAQPVEDNPYGLRE